MRFPCAMCWSRIRWDENASVASPIVHRYILHFFLEDGTVEMRELADIKGGTTRRKHNTEGGKKPYIRPPFSMPSVLAALQVHVYTVRELCLTPACSAKHAQRVFGGISCFRPCMK